MPEVAHSDNVIKEIAKDRKYERTDTTDVLADHVAKIAGFDKFVRGKLTLFFVLGALSLVGGFVWFGLKLSSQLDVVAWLLLAAGVFGIVKGFMWWGRDIPDERHELAGKLIDLIARDSSPDAAVALKLGLSSVNSSEHRITDPKVAVRSDRNYYQAEWLQLRGRLADKTRYLLSVTEVLQVKHRKSKQKPKGFTITLVLAYPPKRYGAAKQLEQHFAGNIKLPAGVSVKSMRVSERILRLTVKHPPGGVMIGGEKLSNKLYQTIAMMLLSAYQLLNAGRAIEKASKGSSGG